MRCIPLAGRSSNLNPVKEFVGPCVPEFGDPRRYTSMGIEFIISEKTVISGSGLRKYFSKMGKLFLYDTVGASFEFPLLGS
jgi:hypothetical protein